MSKQYIKGRFFEYRVKKKLEKEGCIVLRTAGSHGLFDLIHLVLFEPRSGDPARQGLLIGLHQLKTSLTQEQAYRIAEDIMKKVFEVDREVFKIMVPRHMIIDKNIHSISFLGRFKDTFETYVILLSIGVIYSPKKSKKKEVVPTTPESS
jgi:hypothetical protein